MTSNLSETVKTYSYSLVAADAGKLVVFAASSQAVAALPSLATSASELYHLLNTGPAPVEVAPAGSDLIAGAASVSLSGGEMATVWPNADKTAWRLSRGLSDRVRSLPEVLFDGPVEEVGSWSSVDLSGFVGLELSGFLKPENAGCPLIMEFSVDNGATFEDSGYQFGHLYGINNGTYNNEVSPSSNFQVSTTGYVGQGGVAFCCKVFRFNKDEPAWISGESQAITTSGLHAFGTTFGRHDLAQARDGIRLRFSSSEVESGNIRLVGSRG